MVLAEGELGQILGRHKYLALSGRHAVQHSIHHLNDTAACGRATACPRPKDQRSTLDTSHSLRTCTVVSVAVDHGGRGLPPSTRGCRLRVHLPLPHVWIDGWR